MNTLRAKIALLLIVAIVSVVGLLTLVMLSFLGPPSPQRTIEPVAGQIELITRIAKTDTSAFTLAKKPAGGRLYGRTTQLLRDELAQRGLDLAVDVSRRDRASPLVVSIPMGGQGWFLMPISDLPPQGTPWRGVARWLALITVGATVIAVFAANRMVKPLVLLESTLASVGPDGNLPLLPERGPAEVRVTARALNSLSSRLRKAVESRMRLVAAAGHDLRTPITRMRLRAEFVEDDEERRLWLKDLDELERIADSAILLVREESGMPGAEMLRLDDLVADIAAELKEQNLDVAVLAADPVSVKASRLGLSRALRNLIINAATHGRRASVRVEGGGNGRAKVIIEDEGPGIPPELMDQVFEPFFRADPARRQNIEGAGLGLTIAREIVQRAGGNIAIANREERGLQQIVELTRVEDVWDAGESDASPSTPR